jgi:hypothetical protein
MRSTTPATTTTEQTASLVAVTTDGWAYYVFGAMLTSLLYQEEFEAHRRSLTANAALQQRCAAMLLRCFHAAGRGLARTPPQTALGKPCRTDSFILEGVASCFDSSLCLHGAIEHQLSIEDPVALLRSAMDIFAQLDLPASLAAPALDSSSAAVAGGSRTHHATVAPQCHVLIASIMSVTLTNMQQRMKQPSADVRAALPEVARHLVQQVPQFAWLISSLASPAAQPALLAMLQEAGCILPRDLLMTLCAVSEPCLRCTTWAQAISSTEELREWSAAADAALRLLPVAVDWWEQFGESVRREGQREQGSGVKPQIKPDLAARDLVYRCLGVWSQAVSMADAYVDQVLSGQPEATVVVGAAPEQATQLAPLLWQLHGQSCRLVHYIVGSRSEWQTLMRGGLVQGWGQLAEKLFRAFDSCAGLLLALLDRGVEAGRGRWRWVEWEGATLRDMCPEACPHLRLQVYAALSCCCALGSDGSADAAPWFGRSGRLPLDHFEGHLLRAEHRSQQPPLPRVGADSCAFVPGKHELERDLVKTWLPRASHGFPCRSLPLSSASSSSCFPCCMVRRPWALPSPLSIAV